MKSTKNRTISFIAIFVLVLACFVPVSAFAADGRATFDSGNSVRDAWIDLAGGKNNVTSIRQYTGSEIPEGVTTKTVSASDSELPIYSWFEDGTIYYWSEDPKPYTNPDASYMFYGFEEVTFIDSAPFDTSKTTDMEAMFADCGKLETLDVSGFDTSSAKCMYCMFIYDSSLKELDVSHFNTSNCTSTSHQGYGSLCGMFLGCSSVTELDLSSFDMTRSSWPYLTQNMFPGCTSLEKLILGPNVRFNSYTALSGSWTHVEDGLTLSGSELCRQYNATNAFPYSGTWYRNMPEGHYYRTDGSLGQTNLWEVHTPADRFKGYCLNLNKFGVGEELDRVLAEDDATIAELLCTSDQGSVHGSEPLGSTMREALITLIYYGWPNDGAGIQQRYGLSDQEYLEVTQNAIWDFTDRYDEPAGPTLYEGAALEAYNDLVSQRFANIDGEYILFLYKSWDPSKQNLLSIMGVDDQEYGGVAVRKQNADGSENLAGAEFTVYDKDGNEVGTMTTSANGTAYICRTDHTAGLPLGEYTIRETTPPAGYYLSDIVYHFKITEANEIVTEGWYETPDGDKVEEMIYFDAHDDTYVGGGVGVMKESDTGKMLVGAHFTIYDASGKEVTELVTNDAGIAATGKQDLPLGSYTIKETEAPEGHTLTSDTQSFEITENFQFLTLTFTDNEKHGSITLQAQKILDAEDQQLEEGMFTFELLDDHYRTIQTATNDADGNVVFKTIEYTPDDLGYKNYHIVEVIGDDASIRYDRHQEDVTVTIYDTGESELSCTAIYDSDGAVFTNTFGAVKHEVSFLKTKLNTDDVVEGAVLELRDTANRLIESWTSDGEPHVIALDPGTYVLREITAPKGYFEFSDAKFEVSEDGTLTSDSEAVSIDGLSMNVFDKSVPSTEFELKKIDGESGQALAGAEFTLEGTGDSSYSASVTTDENGMARFDGLETGTYTLTETVVPKYYTSEDGPWTVEVVYNRAISKSANVSATGTAAGDYSNEEITDTITIPGSPESIHVELKYQTEDDYDYLELLDADGNVITEDADGNAIGDTRASYKGRIWGGMESGQINTLAFDLPGDTVTFHFVPDANTAAYGYYGIVTSDSRISITDSTGEAIDPEDGLYVFENQKIDIKSTSVTLGGTKTLEGKSLEEGEFTFELTDPSGTTVTTTNAADGSYSFPEMTYTEEGTYTYEVRELPGTEEGMFYDPKTYSVTVTVSLPDDGSGQLVATVSGDSETGADLDFANTYTKGGDESSATVTLGGTKTLEGKKLEELEFTFTLKDANGVVAAVKNASDGSYVFPEMTYYEEGTFAYEVFENDTGEKGVTYDTKVYAVTVTIAYDEDNQLVATISGDSTSGTDLNFKNTYKEDGTTPSSDSSSGIVNTGDSGSLTVGALVALAVAAGFALTVAFARRRKE